MISIPQLLTSVGAAVALKATYDVLSFFALYLKPSQYHRYLYGTSSYALVTGASDGIGKALAKELSAKGFNLIIHGRNEEKLRKVQEELRRAGSRDVKIWVADAAAPNPDFEKAVAQWEGLRISLVIHNVGGSDTFPVRIDQIPEVELMDLVRSNALFPFALTRALLPKLRQVAGPVEMIFVGSFSAELPLPALVTYSATKAFLKRLSICINQDERFQGVSNVSTMYLSVGNVVSSAHKLKPSLDVPTSETFAKSAVARIGCGRREVIPYMPHAFQFWIVSLLPSVVLDTVITRNMVDELKAAKKI